MTQANDIATNAANAESERWYIQEIFKAEAQLPSNRVHEVRQQYEAMDFDGYLTALQSAAEESRAA